MQKSIRVISDPGHGWLEVPQADLDALGIAADISGYSYRKGGNAYLEEDCDAGAYIRALEATGHPRPEFVEVFQDPCPVRSYAGYWEGR